MHVCIFSHLSYVSSTEVAFTRDQCGSVSSGSELVWHDNTVAVQFRTGSLSQVNPFGTGLENQSRADLPGPVETQGL